MEYKALTTENQRDLLKKRLINYEITHFEQTCEHELAKITGQKELEDAALEQAEGFEKLIVWCHGKLAEFDSALQTSS